MIWFLRAFWALGALLLAQSAVALAEGWGFLRYVRRRRRQPPGDFAPPAAVLIPCKGLDADFEPNLSSYLHQDYPRYQLIFIVASEDDPAFRALRARWDAPPNPKTALVIAGFSEMRGEKVHNLLRGLEAVEPAAEILVFADIDARPKRDWLRSLVAPLGDPAITVSSGFRWYLPGEGFPSRLRAAWDTSIATMLGEHGHNFAWGGSMAIRAADFRRLEVAERCWARTASDDYALTRAVREARGHIHFEPRCLLASREESSFGEFFRWANRQIIITRVYAPHLWRLGVAAYLFYGLTMVSGVGALLLPGPSGATRGGVATILAAILVLGAAKGRLRSVVARELFPEEGEILARHGAAYWLLTPLVPWLMLANFLTAAFTRRIEWRGTRYKLVSAEEVRVLGRGGFQ